MNEMMIKRHSFDLAKNRLKEFSERTEAELEIDKVETDGGFLGLGDHKVTGYELNRRLETIQGHFIAVNTTNNKVIKEFREIYNALDALDRDYIASIVANVKAIEKTSNDVRVQQGTLKQHNEKLASQQSKLDAHQVEIEKNVANISKVVAALKLFKEKLESYKHLSDIDKIWNDCQKWHQEISALSGHISDAIAKSSSANAKAINDVKALLKDTDDKAGKLAESLSDQICRIDEISAFISELQNMAHLKDIDDMWDALTNALCSLKELTSELETVKRDISLQKQDIAKALTFVDRVSQYEHLQDVDAMWNDVESHSKKLGALDEQSNKLSTAIAETQSDVRALETHRKDIEAIIHLKDVDDTWASTEKHTLQIEELQNQDDEIKMLIQQNRDFLDQVLKIEKEANDSAIQQLNKKIQYAYWIAGGSMALAVFEMLLLLLR